MRIELDNEFTQLSVTKGTLQNISAFSTIEIATDETENSGVVLAPREKLQFLSDVTVYARSIMGDDAVLAVEPFTDAAEGGGGGYVLPIASASVLGGIKVGQNLTINSTTGVLDATGTSYTLPTASSSVLGGVKIGNNLSIDQNGVLSAAGSSYTLPVATDIILGGVKSTDAEGGVTVKSDGTMTYNVPPASVDPISSTAWAENTVYVVNNIVGYDGTVYVCLVAHISSSDFDDDYLLGYWNKVDMPRVGKSGYAQVLVLGVTGASSANPHYTSIAINPTNSFILPPVDVLKETPASSTILNDLHFDNADATDFNYDSDFVSFDGTMHLKTQYDPNMSSPSALDTKYLSTSSVIDIDDYDAISNIESMEWYASDANALALISVQNGQIVDATARQTWTSYGSNPPEAVSDGSIHATGSGWLETTGSGLFSLDGDFTIEWMYKPPASGNRWNGAAGTVLETSAPIHMFSSDFRFGYNTVSGPYHSIPVASDDGQFHHYAYVRSGNNMYGFRDGVKVLTSTDSASYSNSIYRLFAQSSGSNAIIGDFVNIRISNIARWTADFAPPNNVATLYLAASGKVYGFNGGTFGLVAQNWNALSASQKEQFFDDYGYGAMTESDFASIAEDFQSCMRVDYGIAPSATMSAVPFAQTITPKGRISLMKYTRITGVTITGAATGNGVVKIAMTKDNSTYQVYDTTNNAWTTINIADIDTDGMTISEVGALTSAEWIAYDCMTTGLGFAYYLEIADTTDTAYTDELSLNVELFGKITSLTKGTDYDYAYVSNTVLQVKLYTNGDFRINYNPGAAP